MTAGADMWRAQNVQGIVDHIDGYPKIYNFTLVM